MNRNNIIINNELQLYNGLTFEEFTKSSFFNNQQNNRFFWLADTCSINNLSHIFRIGLWFEKGLLRQAEIFCVDDIVKNEKEREVIHNQIVCEILEHYDIEKDKINVFYDKREQYSSIFVNF